MLFIRNKIPSIFYIQQTINEILSYPLNIDEYNDVNDYKKDNEYKLFNTNYRKGKCFYLNTKYIHTMSNIDDKAYIFKNNINLEELIYSCNLETLEHKISFYNKLKIIYDLREYELNIIKDLSKKENNKEKQNKICENIDEKNRSDKVFCLYDKGKPQILNINPIRNTKNININKDSKIILIYKNNINEILFIIKNINNEFYKLIIKLNILNSIDNIIEYIFIKKINTNIFKKMFIIIDYQKLSNKDYDDIFLYNPLVLRKLQNPKLNHLESDKIDITLFYNTDMKTIPNNDISRIIMPNLYVKDKSLFYNNLIKDSFYIENRNLYIENRNLYIKKQNINCNNIRIFMDEFKNDLNINKLIMNCAFINIDDCGYDFWEIINTKENKLLVFIIPHNYNYKTDYDTNPIYKTKYLGNFFDLDNTSIKLLEILQNKYYNKGYLCFFRYTLTMKNNTLHLHIIKEDYYYNVFFQKNRLEMSSFLLQSINLKSLLNNIKITNLYYNNINNNIILRF